jgi:hypothetical protein
VRAALNAFNVESGTNPSQSDEMAEDPESIARQLLQLRRLRKRFALTPEAEATYQALEQAKKAGAAPPWVQYLTDQLAFEVGNADQPSELPSKSAPPGSKSELSEPKPKPETSNPSALPGAELQSHTPLSPAQSVEPEQSEPFPPTLQLFEPESEPFLELEKQAPAPANSLCVSEKRSKSEEKHKEQQPEPTKSEPTPQQAHVMNKLRQKFRSTHGIPPPEVNRKSLVTELNTNMTDFYAAQKKLRYEAQKGLRDSAEEQSDSAED